MRSLIERHGIIAVLSGADLLLNFPKESIRQMPSKLVDDVYVDKPVLTLTPQGFPHGGYLKIEMVCEAGRDQIMGS